MVEHYLISYIPQYDVIIKLYQFINTWYMATARIQIIIKIQLLVILVVNNPQPDFYFI